MTKAKTMALKTVTMGDKYTSTDGRIYLSGTQALVRLPLAQARRDRKAGLDTGGFIAGYRGSPLAAYDIQLQQQSRLLDQHGIVFQPAVNEDLAASAVWGTQQLGLSPGATKDGVFSIWYGKGPGVDRSGDVFKHANAAGSARYGGVLCLAGDDHAAKSSTLPHQSEHAFAAALIPVLFPSSVHEFIDMGLLGLAMSRYSGCWVGMKLIADTVETTAAVDIGNEMRQYLMPADFAMPAGGLNLRWPDDRWSQDIRLQEHKGYAALAFAHANRIDRVILDSAKARLGIVASGRAYESARQALAELGVDEKNIDDYGVRLYKVGMPWPLEPRGVREFSEGLQEILILEERREMIENQLKHELFNWHSDRRPRVHGKFDDDDKPLLTHYQLLPTEVVVPLIADRLLKIGLSPDLEARIEERAAWFRERAVDSGKYQPPVTRKAWFCSGCPHNSSTKVPEGSRALAGIGCHFMALWMNRDTETFTHMGGEGVPWVGTAPFTKEKHIFVNMGDGTYHHSGLLAVRQAVAAKVAITYKILFNDAVAMTGGQRVDGPLSPELISWQLQHEGVSPIHVVSDGHRNYDRRKFAAGIQFHGRGEIDGVMRQLRQTQGCSAIIYDQTCAAEKRRRRKRGLMEDPAQRLFINPLVCEGCGDCTVQSNCIAVEPLETALGRKRRINQSMCNKDYSCLNGFCPSFVTVEGGQLRRAAGNGSELLTAELPEPPAQTAKGCSIAVAGIGGTGVLTIGAVLGMAAHIEGRAVMVLDASGLAQKGGAVLSQIRIGGLHESGGYLGAPHIASGQADLLLAADSVVGAAKDSIELCSPQHTKAIVNAHLAPVADFLLDRDFDFRQSEVEKAIAERTGEGLEVRDFARVARFVSGDEIMTNILMVGYACQRGLIPLSQEAVERAIELNGVAIDDNLAAFRCGRLYAARPEMVERVLASSSEAGEPEPEGLDALIENRAEYLTAYQNKNLAERYRRQVEKVRLACRDRGLADELVRAVAQQYFRVLSYKDEYEVARLHSDGSFARQLETEFTGGYRIRYHLAPPLLRGKDAAGRPLKRAFGSWMGAVFRLLARCKGLRGTAFDPFGYSPDRRCERRLIDDFEALVDRWLPLLNAATAVQIEEIWSSFGEIRGFGPVKRASIERAQRKISQLERDFSSGSKNIEMKETRVDEPLSG